MSTPQTPEPTDEQRSAAFDAVVAWGVDAPSLGGLTDLIARALAAAVQQERDRLRALIDDVIVDNGLTCHPFPSNNPCQCSTARAIREVSR